MTNFRLLRDLKFVERAMVTASTIRSILAEARITKLLAAQHPMNQIPRRWPLRPFRVRQFGASVSWNMESSASIAAFTATAWWIIGTAPE